MEVGPDRMAMGQPWGAPVPSRCQPALPRSTVDRTGGNSERGHHRPSSVGRRHTYGIALALVAALAGLVYAHLESEAFRRSVSWRITRPYYAHQLRTSTPLGQSRLLQVLGRREHMIYEGLLLAHATAPTVHVRRDAQQMLMEHHPESWPAKARDEYEVLSGQRYDRWRSSVWWSGDAFERELPGAGDARRWSAFLARYPDFVGADGAYLQLAHHLHRDDDRRGAIVALDAGLRRDDGSRLRAVFAALRHYLVEEASDEDLMAWSEDGDLDGNTRWLAGYSLGLQQLWRLELRAAGRTFRDLEAPPSLVAAQVRFPRQQDRVALLRRLAPFEAALERAPAGARAEAAVTLAYEVTRVDHELGERVGLFEPWVLVDVNTPHFASTYLDPLLAETASRATNGSLRARALYLRAYLRWRAAEARRGPVRVAFDDAWPDASAARAQLTELARDHPRTPEGRAATRSLRRPGRLSLDPLPPRHAPTG